jgi:hypothetical protein
MRIGAGLICLAVLVGGCGGSSPTAPGVAPEVRGIQPAEIAVGDTAVITGSGFTASANSVHLGPGYLKDLASSDGTSIRFALPTALSPCPPSAEVCAALAVLLTPGTYSLSVVNANGTSNDITLRIVAR